MPIDKSKLTKVSNVYPLKVSPYEQYMGDFSNPSVVSKINSMVQTLLQMGRLTNQTVSQWNTVMEWIVNGGMDEIATDITTEKVEVALNEVMRMLDVSLNNGLKDLATDVTDKKISELLASGQFESMISESLVEINEVVEGKLEGFNLLLADTLLLISPIGTILNVANDGTQDISIPLKEYAEGKDSIYLYFPPGNYRWDNNVRLSNKKIKLVGDNATIEHYATGTVLDIGDELTKNTEEASILGINFINKKPKPASGGSGVSAIQIRDCVDVLIRDVVITDVEQYGINLRRSGGTIKNAVLDNVKVLKCSGTLSTTTSIALETRAASGDGKIESIKISNCYFEVTDSYINEQGTVTNVNLSNAAKLQACDAVDIVNTTFKGGKENGPLSFIFNTKKVSLTNVKLISDSTSSKGLTISSCPNLELSAVNSDLGVENFVQSIGINDSVKMVKLTNCRLQRIIGISGTPENFELNACNFFLPTTNLQIGVNNSVFNNCTIDRNSPMKGIVVSGNGNKFNNLNGAVVFEVIGNDIEITGGSCESIRPGGASKRGYVKGLKATSSDRSLRTLTETVEDWTFEDCVFERTVGGGTGHFAHLQGVRNKIIKSRFRLINKSTPVTYPLYISNATNCEVIEKNNIFDVEKAASYNMRNETTSAGFKQYEIGDVFLNTGVPEMWNGTGFVVI